MFFACNEQNFHTSWHVFYFSIPFWALNAHISIQIWTHPSRCVSLNPGQFVYICYCRSWTFIQLCSAQVMLLYFFWSFYSGCQQATMKYLNSELLNNEWNSDELLKQTYSWVTYCFSAFSLSSRKNNAVARKNMPPRTMMKGQSMRA